MAHTRRREAADPRLAGQIRRWLRDEDERPFLTARASTASHSASQRVAALKPRQRCQAMKAAATWHVQRQPAIASRRPIIPDTEEVTGSIPVPPTVFAQIRGQFPESGTGLLDHLSSVCHQDSPDLNDKNGHLAIPVGRVAVPPPGHGGRSASVRF
jgi:hypothetical protein